MTFQTFAPIYSRESYENGIFSPIPIPPAGYAYVLTSERMESPPLVIQAGLVPTKQQIRMGKYNKKACVDIQQHLIGFGADVLSADNVSKFQIEISMMAQVRQPMTVCMENVSETTAVAKAMLLPQLQRLACHRRPDEPQALREDILAGVGNVIHLECGISLSDINVKVELDHAVADHMRGIRDLQYKGEYEEIRAREAEKLSQLYQDPIKQIFAEFASGDITAAEAAKRIKADSSDDFDERVRRVREIAALAKELQDSGLSEPGILSGQTDQLIGALISGTTKGIQGAEESQTGLEAGIPEEQLYAQPED